ncbi:hypothetical protein [Pistricoccus aurantiacus]|uniref:hypothetical protein n=1 Tax=Pistricoccus aurantiacus TaxID=1883414 RepID=UPI0036418232
MACQIVISPPSGQETTAGQGLSTLSVSGTATDCSSVRVQVHQTQPVDVFTPQRTAAVTNGQWSVDFTVEAADFQPGTFFCGDGNKYDIHAECADDSTCFASLSGELINCGDCPNVSITITPRDCVNGRRTVHLKADVITATDATYIWFFGTDEDNQPGEDSQAGDGSGNPWLPPPDSNGVRVVEMDHVYEPSSDQPQTITVRFATSSGPSSTCIAEREFTLDPCRCDLNVVLQVADQVGQVFPARECLPPGNYIVQVVNPAESDTTYSWSVNGVADNSQIGSTFNISIAAGEEITVSVVVTQGGCTASNGVTVAGCEDCSGFDARLRILDRNRQDVTNEECLPQGDYTVQATSPADGGNAFRWSVDNVVDDTATDTTLAIALGNNDRRIVTLEAARGACRDIASVVLRTCRPADDRDDDVFIPCLLFKVLALLGLGLVFLGAVLLLCPLVAAPFPPEVAVAIGIGLSIGGALLLGLGLLLWFLICQPSACDWLAFLWQALFLLGLVMIYAGLCPGCSWMLVGVIPLIAGAGTSIAWGRNCRPTPCRVLTEWITLFTFVVNVVAILEMVLAACVITSRPIASIIWGLMIAAVQAWLWFEANRRNCIRT